MVGTFIQCGRDNAPMPSGQRRPDLDTDTPVPGHFRPRLTLQTLTRGDGLLGLRAAPGFGPRGAQVTVAQAHWTYATAQGLNWEGPAPTKVLGTRPRAGRAARRRG
jgi:hypothetical protein